jgi:hypothetical protein
LNETIFLSIREPIPIITNKRLHVVTVDDVDREADHEGQADQRVGGHASHGREAADLAVELLPLAHGVGDHVEEPGQRASDLALNRHGAHDKLEVLRADSRRHVGERVVHRPPEARLVQDALELLGGRVDAFVDDALDALAEAVAGLERGRHRHEHVRQLLVERLQPPARLEREEGIREKRADAEPDHEPEGRARKGRAQEGEEQAEAEDDVGELGCLEWPVRPLEQRVDLFPLLQVPEDALGGLEEAGEHREALPFALALESLRPR